MNDSFDPREAAKQAAQQRLAKAQDGATSSAPSEQPVQQVAPAVQQVAPAVQYAAPAPPIAPVAPVAVPMTAAEQMNAQLLQILIQQQARLAAKDLQEEERIKARDKQREKNAQDHTTRDLLRQARCSHLKGGRKGPRSQVRDYAVGIHTFITGRPEIRCFICKMIWKMNDTAEFLIRNGRKIANHTKLGWYEATKMLEQTTNTPSSSEVPQQAIPQAILQE